MLERKILSTFFFFFFSQLIELFCRTIKKKIKNPTKYELFLSKPLGVWLVQLVTSGTRILEDRRSNPCRCL